MKYIAPNTAVKTIEKKNRKKLQKKKARKQFQYSRLKFEVRNVGCVSTTGRGTENENNKR